MRILFDSCCPRPLRKYLSGHEVTTAQELGWEELKNGELLQRAQEQFDVMISTDSNIEYQQRLPAYGIALIVLRSLSGQVAELTQIMPDCLKALSVVQQTVYKDKFFGKSENAVIIENLPMRHCETCGESYI
jgi:YgiT-type zinc finger domain-containing protein